jgi:hypothetical protein
MALRVFCFMGLILRVVIDNNAPLSGLIITEGMLGRVIATMQLDLHEALIMSSYDDNNRALKNEDQNYAHNSCT